MGRTIVVKPLPDGVAQRNSWQVTVSGARKSKHTRKTAANNKARNVAQPGDVIELRRMDGTVQSRSKYRGGQTGNSDKGHDWDVDDTQRDYDDLLNLF